jgi:pyruvate-formate lyase
LDANFAGYEKERHWLRNAPKYGNDQDAADEMAVRVYRQVCAAVKAHRERLKLDFCLADLINAGGHIELGKLTGALADGRLAGQPLANANNPSNGNDRLGATALLNSLVKLAPSAIGGQVQYLKINRELFTHSRGKLKALLETYFDTGGSQAMITVVSRDDLENAMREPGKYGNLIVRIGGYCERFVSLSPDFQKEIIARTLQN